jgi:uncharacterized protein YheU (UPF0270 family)
MSVNSKELTHETIENLLRSVIGRINGSDTDGNEYKNVTSLWKKMLRPQRESTNSLFLAEQKAKEVPWYGKAFDYWESESNCPITDGTDFDFDKKNVFFG